MGRFAIGTTFKAGEYEELIRSLSKGAISPERTGASTRGLLKTLQVDVTYPDGSPGVCCYERKGPELHYLDYWMGAKEHRMAREHCFDPMSNNVLTIERYCRDHATEAYQTAIDTERKAYFCRATAESPIMYGNRARTAHSDYFIPGMTAAQAKELQGKYALVDRCNAVRCSDVCDDIATANLKYHGLAAAFIERGDEISETLAVMCFNRLDRCWQIPTYNPIYGEFPHLRRKADEPYG